MDTLLLPHAIAKDLKLDPPTSLSVPVPLAQAWATSEGLVPGRHSSCAHSGPGCPPGANLGWGNQESRHCLLRTQPQTMARIKGYANRGRAT